MGEVMEVRIPKWALALGTGVILILASAMALQGCASAGGQAKTVDAERLVIRDSKRRVRIELAVVDDEPVIRLMNESEQPVFDIIAVPGPEGFRFRTYSGGSMGNWDPIDILTQDHHIPEIAELKVLEMNAWLNTDAYGLTDKLVTKSFRAELVRLPQEEEGYSAYGIRAMVDTKTQPRWNTYLGAGRFSVSDREIKVAYEEAAEALLSDITNFLPIWRSNLEITFQIDTNYVGTWKNGVMQLVGDR